MADSSIFIQQEEKKKILNELNFIFSTPKDQRIIQQ